MRRPEEKRVLTVSEITGRIVKALEQGFPDVRVRGEITEFVRHGSGHWYFSLKDDKARIRAVMFKFQNVLVPFAPEDGMEVICRGRISAYAPRGTYQLYVEWIELEGRGALHIEFEKLKEKLLKEGLFDQARKRPVPSPARRVAIITSAGGAALQDMLRTFRERDPSIRILIVPSRVQGEGAAVDLVRALALANRAGVAGAKESRPLDAVIMGRGGGSIEDLWAFNEETLARAIHASAIPVVSAVGHEVDFTIADFVADMRAPTPTAAAEMVAAGRAERIQRLEHGWFRLGAAMGRRLDDRIEGLHFSASRLTHPGRQIRDYMIRCDEVSGRIERAAQARLENLAGRLGAARATLLARDPRGRHRLMRARLDGLGVRLAAAGRGRVQAGLHRVDSCVGRLEVLSPRATLSRGYAIARRRDGRVVREATEVGVGEALDVVLYRGRLDCEVKKVEPEDQ